MPWFTDKLAAAAEPAAAGKRHYIIYDSKDPTKKTDQSVTGLGLRTTETGAKAWVLRYRLGARNPTYTIGSFPDWNAKQARKEARRLRRLIDGGIDPMADRHRERGAPSVSDLAVRYLEEHAPKKRTAAGDAAMIKAIILPALGTQKVADVTFADTDGLHRRITKRGKPVRANRVKSLGSKMWNLAIKWGWATSNPWRGIERNPEQPRRRYLDGSEIGRLMTALDQHPNGQSANAIRLLLLTGSRRGEVLRATWNTIDLGQGIWVKPASTTKQRREHHLSLSPPAIELLRNMRAREVALAKQEKRPPADLVFPGRRGAKAQSDLKKFWAKICGAAGLAEQVEQRTRFGKIVRKRNGEPRVIWKPTIRLHDLRHTHASLAVSAGYSLPQIGDLLGHSSPVTTSRYAHLYRDVQREAAAAVAQQIEAFRKSAPRKARLSVVKP